MISVIGQINFIRENGGGGGYTCGPVGLDVPNMTGILFPCVNALGLGLGAEKVWLDESTMHLP